MLARNKKWREKNKNKKREIDKIYREKNKEILREKKKLYREKNKESIAKKKKRHLERPALFHTYNERLSYAEETRIRDIYLEIKCTYCGIWYLPNTGCVIERIRTLEGHKSGEQRLYCSEECKKECPIYSQSKYPKGFKPSTSREVQPELRQMVFERDEWTCQRCESTTSLHCHHITGVEQNPIESADIDNCITLCKDCHKYVHSQEGCRYFDLRRCA